MVEYLGMRNLMNAVKGSVGLRNGKILFGFEDDSFKELPWGALDDVVMGGVSESTFQIDRTGGDNGAPTGLSKGVVSLQIMAALLVSEQGILLSQRMFLHMMVWSCA